MRIAKIEVVTTGADGSATGTAYSTSPLSGELVALKVDWGTTAPAGTSDIAITSEKSPTITYYTKDNAATDVWVYPVVQSTDNAGGAVADQYQHYPVVDRLKVVVAGCNALDPAVTVYAFVREQ